MTCTAQAQAQAQGQAKAMTIRSRLRLSRSHSHIGIGIWKPGSWPTICRLSGAREYFGTNILYAHRIYSLAGIDLVRPTMQQLQSCDICVLTPSG